MEISNIIRVILAGTCLLSGSVFIFWAIARKSNRARNFRIAGLSFLAMYLINVSIIKFQNMIYMPTNKIGQLKFLAFGTAINGEKGWIGLYEDSTWEFGKLYREINTNGTYVLKGDTVILTSMPPTGEHFDKTLLLDNNQESNSPDSKLNGLRIELNETIKYEL